LKPHVVVFGSQGQLASCLKRTALADTAVFLGSDQVCIKNGDRIREALDFHRPSVIVNTSAYTAVDAAESDRSACETINATAAGVLAEWAAKNDSSLVHFSTDYVFSGEGSEPWQETDATSPINWYGETKVRGERLIEKSDCHSVIFRTSWLFSPMRNSFVKTILRLAREKTSLRIVGDQFGSPTYAPDLADLVSESLDRIRAREVSGLYHVRNEGLTTWHGLAEETLSRAERFGFQSTVETVEAIPSSEYPSAARRPTNGRLNVEKLGRDFGRSLPPWQESLERCLLALREER
jgi:dTDP-4-dehydrorhamnose reductase